MKKQKKKEAEIIVHKQNFIEKALNHWVATLVMEIVIWIAIAFVASLLLAANTVFNIIGIFLMIIATVVVIYKIVTYFKKLK